MSRIVSRWNASYTLLLCLVFCASTGLTFAPPDGDGDGHPAGSDCNDSDSSVWSIPGETPNLFFNPNKTTIQWSPPTVPGGTAAATLYDTLRSRFAYDFACDTAVCTAADVLPTSSSDATIPSAGEALYYVSRASNACGTGTIGFRSNGAERAALTGDCEDLCHVSNSGFDQGLTGWILEGNCTYSSRVIRDSAMHGNVFELAFSGGGACGPTTLWQVAVVDVDAQADVRVRLDVKLMRYGGLYTGPIKLKIYAGTSHPYNQVLIGTHEFQPGSLSETSALTGTTTLPVGTWYAYTSDDIRPLFPPGTQFVRVEMSEGGNANYGWGRVDNIKVVLNDFVMPSVGANPPTTGGHPPLLVSFTGSCSDGDGMCVGRSWDFGDGPFDVGTPGGGGSSPLLSPSYTFPQSRTYNVSFTADDDRGGAQSKLVTVTPVNIPPTVSILASPGTGNSPLLVNFTSVVTDDHLIASYAWTFGDGGTSSLANPSHTFAPAGTYDVNLTVTDDHGATGTARYTIVATRGVAQGSLSNNGFDNGTSGWVVEGNCSNPSTVIADDTARGNAFELNFQGGGTCGPTLLWQVAPTDVDAQTSVRVRADIKMMRYSGVYTGPVMLKVYAGTSSPYDQTLVGTHVFQAGSLSETSALNGTTTLPLGTWYAYTSDNIKSLFPAGTQFIRVELSEAGATNFGWGRVDNVKIVLNDGLLPTGTENPPTAGGHPPVFVSFTGTCSDGDGVCAVTMWDFGDGPLDVGTAGGGGASTAMSPSYTFPDSRTYNVSYTIEDDRGAARSLPATITPVNLPPTASIQASPASGSSPLLVNFTSFVADDHLISSYAWTFGDGGTSSAANPSHTFTSPGTYDVRLTVTDDHGATGTARYAIVATGTQPISNGDFAGGTSGWILDGNCSYSSQVIADDPLHGNAFELSFSGGGTCGATLLWQVAAVDINSQTSVRVRVDVKLMAYFGFYTGPVHLKVYAGTSSPYDQTLVGTHDFQPGSFSETNALSGTTTLPLGTWYAYTSDNIKPLFPAGTQFVRVELSEAGAANFGWGRVDNVKVIRNDAAAPVPGMTANPTNGSAPLLVNFTGSCSDDGSCTGLAWDFGDGTTIAGTPGGGGTSTSASPSYTFSGNRTYNVSLTVQDDKGAGRSTINSISTVNIPPSASIQAVPSTGPAPLNVQFTAVASDSDGTIVSYAWNFGDGATSTVQNPAHIYSTPGTYQVTLTVTDNQGAFTTVSYTIVVT